MKIPEGWPTDEMLFAAREACDDMFQTDFIVAFKAALSAAPTPPAEIPHGFTADTWGALEKAIDAGYDGNAMCVLPPAPEDEPYGYLYEDNYGSPLFDYARSAWDAERRTEVKLYTRPDNSGLRKAAWKYLKSNSYGTAEERRRDLENLRAALEGN